MYDCAIVPYTKVQLNGFVLFFVNVGVAEGTPDSTMRRVCKRNGRRNDSSCFVVSAACFAHLVMQQTD